MTDSTTAVAAQHAGHSVAQVHDAETVAVGIFENDEVGVVRVAVPVDRPGPQGDQPSGFGFLLSDVGDVEVEMQARAGLRCSFAAL